MGDSSFREMINGILEWYFAGTYRLAQVVARASRCSGLPYLGCLLFILVLALWTSGLMVSAFFGIWEQCFKWQRYGWVWISLLFLALVWLHYFLFCFALSAWGLERKARKLKRAKEAIDKFNPREVAGLDLIKAKQIKITELNWGENLQVLGSGIRVRNFLQKSLEADIECGHQIFLFAPENQNILEEVTHILRGRDSEVRSFFLFSLRRPEISASYSPFYGETFKFLRDWLKLKREGLEATVLERLMKSLAKNGKPYELDDLLLLLKDKRASAALNEIELMREYLWHFDSLKKYRDSLAEKLSNFGTKMKLEKYTITQGYPLYLQDILKSKKHLFFELGPKSLSLTEYVITQLFHELPSNQSYDYLTIYLIFPEEFEEQYPLEQYFKDLKLDAKLRIFSLRFSPLYSKDKRWSSLILPNVPEIVCKNPEYESLMQEIAKERQRLQEQSNLMGFLNEETFESTGPLIKEADISTCAGLFPNYRIGRYPFDCRLFYISESEPKRMEYEPYQKKFKQEDMLCLRQRIGRVKLDLTKHDPSVLEIIHDLKPKNQDSKKELC